MSHQGQPRFEGGDLTGPLDGGVVGHAAEEQVEGGPLCKIQLDILGLPQGEEQSTAPALPSGIEGRWFLSLPPAL